MGRLDHVQPLLRRKLVGAERGPDLVIKYLGSGAG